MLWIYLDNIAEEYTKGRDSGGSWLPSVQYVINKISFQTEIKSTKNLLSSYKKDGLNYVRDTPCIGIITKYGYQKIKLSVYRSFFYQYLIELFSCHR